MHYLDFSPEFIASHKLVYKTICKKEAIEAHKKMLDDLEAEKLAKVNSAVREAEERQLALARIFSHAARRSRLVWDRMLTHILTATTEQYDAIAAHVNGSFVCAGSFPACIVADVYSKLPDTDDGLRLNFNDIDIYFGHFPP